MDAECLQVLTHSYLHLLESLMRRHRARCYHSNLLVETQLLKRRNFSSYVPMHCSIGRISPVITWPMTW